jgi:HSP20 family protein
MAETKTQQGKAEREGTQALSRREQRGLQRSPGSGAFGDPFDLMSRMTEEFDRAFDRMWRDFGVSRRPWLSRMSQGAAGTLWIPRVETFQKGDQFIVRAELPGLKKDDVHVELTGDALVLRGERREEHEENREGYYHTEREYGEFHRTIPLPEGVITESAQASFRNGVLEITIQAPPAETSHARQVEIKDESETKK